MLPRWSPAFGSCMVLIIVGIYPNIQAFQSAGTPTTSHLLMRQDRKTTWKDVVVVPPPPAAVSFTESALFANVPSDGQPYEFDNVNQYSNSNKLSPYDTNHSMNRSVPMKSASSRTDRNVGGYDPSERLSPEREVNVGDPQIKVAEEKEFSVTSILRELAAIQQAGPRKYCILGTRHCSFLHQQIIELLAYALVLSGNHVYTSGAGGTHAATIRGALRAEKPALLTVVLPQSRRKQSEETQKLLEHVEDVIEMPQNNEMSLDIASRICNSYLLSLTDQLISFAFHESNTVIEATREAKKMNKLVTVLYLD